MRETTGVATQQRPNLGPHHDFAGAGRQAEPGAALMVELERFCDIQFRDWNCASPRAGAPIVGGRGQDGAGDDVFANLLCVAIAKNQHRCGDFRHRGPASAGATRRRCWTGRRTRRRTACRSHRPVTRNLTCVSGGADAQPGIAMTFQQQGFRGLGGWSRSRSRGRWWHEDDLCRRWLHPFGFRVRVPIRKESISAHECSPVAPVAKALTMNPIRAAGSWVQRHRPHMSARCKSHRGATLRPRGRRQKKNSQRPRSNGYGAAPYCVARSHLVTRYSLRKRSSQDHASGRRIWTRPGPATPARGSPLTRKIAKIKIPLIFTLLRTFRYWPYGETSFTFVLMSDVSYYQQVIAELGAEFRGMQQGPRQRLILFADPELRSTLAVAEQEFSPEAVSRRLEESQRAFRSRP